MGNINTKVSVIMPIYNREKLVAEAINSVLNQTYKNLEVIVVDDCSTDNSLDVIKQIISFDNRVKLIALKKNKKAAIARNIGIKESTGRYIAFLDSDDLWDKQKLEKQIEFMNEKNVGFIFSSYRVISKKGKFKKNILVPDKINYNELLKNTIIGCLTVVLDKSKISSLSMVEIKMSEDTATWLKIMKSNNITAYSLKSVLATYRITSNSISKNKFKSAKGMWLIYRKYENINFIKSIYYMFRYSLNAILKRI